MKTLFNILSIIVKIMMTIFSIIGLIMTIAMVILAKPAVHHVYDVVEECEDLDSNDETQGINLMTEAYRRTFSDPKVKNSKFIHAVECGIGRFTSFVANL